MRTQLALTCMALLAGCGTARTVVLDAPDTDVGFSEVTIVARNPTVRVPQSVTDVFESELRQDLFTLGPFSPGTGLELRYSFVSHEEGNRFARWFWGGIGNSGEASVTVLVVYLDGDGREVASTQVEGRIGSGFLGGSIEDAIRQAASDVAGYTINNFASPAQLASDD